MFDLTSSKLLILGFVALLVVPPKDLPALLRTIGRYAGMLRRQADEFRAQFDAAIREAEIDKLKTEMTDLGRGVEDSMRHSMHEADRTMQSGLGEPHGTLEAALAHDPSSAKPTERTPTPAAEPDPAPVGPQPRKGA